MMNKFSNVPMKTQLLEKYESQDGDVRFTKVKIWLMHLGLNYNGSIFTREAVQAAIPTLANTPIMASIGLNAWDEKDFEGHESDIEITEDGEVKFVNKTIPFGVIPEFNNAKFETRLGDDMIEREYLTCEGILWNKWDDALEILFGKNGVTGQSMELSDSFKGTFDGEYFSFSEFQFDGACLLGDDVPPAMQNSTVEITYSQNTKKYIDEKMKQYNTLTFNMKEGGTDLSEDKLKDFEEEVEATEVKEADAPAEEVKEEVKEEEPKKPARKPKAKAEPKEVKEEPKEESVEEVEVKPAVEQVTVDEQSVEEVAEVRKKEAEKELPKLADMILVNSKEYTVADVEALLASLEETKAKYQKLQEEVHVEKAEEMINKFSAELDSEDITSLQAKVKEVSLEELQTQIYAAIGKKKFSAETAVESKPEITFSSVAVKSETRSASQLDEILKSIN